MKTSTSIILLSLLAITTTFTACGSSDSTATSTALTGQLVDTYLQNIDYTCESGESATTDINGTFTCDSLPVVFKLGGLQLGSVSELAADKHVFPQELLGLARTDVNNSSVLAMAKLLQSCDDDNNTQNGIHISDILKAKFTNQESFDETALDTYASDANITLVDDTTALEHLTQTLDLVSTVDDALNLPVTITQAILTPLSTLTPEVKETLAYMGNEERLAYDVYTALYNYHLNTGTELKQLTNIATKSEAIHIKTVQLLVQKYISDLSEFTDTNKTVDANLGLTMDYTNYSTTELPAGQYNIDAIQTLHTELIAKGEQSPQDALEVGCMIEVIDIDDLLRDIEIAKDSNASDVVTSFEFLRDGSYSHYGAFDRGLINMGVTEGCCSLGTEYCHPEYPQTNRIAQ
ncbi:DUF2202 domain-containing protein [Sulfurimonas sp. SAG-AH-194-L11]|nr:DUF2202 domain-containing protein [Sulfurimonas sp. SAG-AH-194-L11]MDF1876602.1 DUF2202 domain-containing protein [Sulfurimonas sp. SAG-AH-194-L11]